MYDKKYLKILIWKSSKEAAQKGVILQYYFWAFETKNADDIVEANRGFRKNLGIIRRGRVKGSGMKRKASKDVSRAGKPLAVSQADKLRIKLIIGEIKAGNNNPMLLKEINKLKKKYSK